MWQNIGEKRYTEKQKPRMVDGRGGEGSGEKREAWKMIEGIRDKGGATTHWLKAPVWLEEKGSQEGGGQSMEEYGGRTVPNA